MKRNRRKKLMESRDEQPPVDPEAVSAPDPPLPVRRSRIKARLIAGVVTLIPIVATITVFLFVSDKLQSLFRPITNQIWNPPYQSMVEFVQGFLKGTGAESRKIVDQFISACNIGLSFILAVITIYLVGLFSSIITVKRLINLGERILERIPGIKTVYGTMKQIAETFTMEKTQESQKVVVIEYPRRDIYALAFVTGESRMQHDPRLFVNVFVPTTPNPTSGFLLILPSTDIREIALTYEQAFKFIISGGLLELSTFQLTPYRPKDSSPLPPQSVDPLHGGRK